MATKEKIEAIPPTKTWTLSPPIPFGAKQYDKLVMRAPTFNEVELTDAEDSPLKQTRKLVQLISGYPPGVIELIPFYIVNEAFRYTTSFTSEGVGAYSEPKS